MALGYKPINRGDVGGLSNEEWLKCRLHGTKMKNGKPVLPVQHAEPGDEGYIEYTLGGSDMAVAAGVSNFSTPLQLYEKKKGLWTPPPPANPEQLQMGHDMEAIAAMWFERKTGAKVIEDTNMYQHPKYPWALADMDRRFIMPDGRRGILEIKTTSYYCKDDWADDSWPEKYDYQLRYYLGVDDCDLGAFICIWGMNPANDMAIRFVDRDLDKEAHIFEEIGQPFINRLFNSDPPTMEGISGEQALEALKLLYKGNKALPSIELGCGFEKDIESFMKYDEELKDANATVKRLEELKKASSIRLIEAMKDHTKGEFNDKNGKTFIITYSTTSRKGGIDTDKLKEDLPDVFEQYKKPDTVYRTMKIAEAKK